MKIVLAPDSFKECLSAAQVAQTLAQAVHAACPEAELVQLSLADGGEGTLEVLAKALGATVYRAGIHDPLGRPIQASFGVAGGTALIEVAQACGLQLLAPQERNPLRASTYGLGELLLAACQKGCRQLLIGLGGTATCDGGAGMLSVPGVKEALQNVSIELLCDVDAPFTGSRGAARVFAPQKGASPEEVEILEQKMQDLARSILSQTGVDVSDMPGAGAAGGLGGAFMAYSHATMVPGIERILELAGFDQAVQDAHLIITGEGKSDRQTLMGKVPWGVLQHAQGVPVALLSGRVENRDDLERAGFHPVLEVTPRSLPLPEALKPERATALLWQAAQELMHLLK